MSNHTLPYSSHKDESLLITSEGIGFLFVVLLLILIDESTLLTDSFKWTREKKITYLKSLIILLLKLNRILYSWPFPEFNQTQCTCDTVPLVVKKRMSQRVQTQKWHYIRLMWPLEEIWFKCESVFWLVSVLTITLLTSQCCWILHSDGSVGVDSFSVAAQVERRSGCKANYRFTLMRWF